MSKKKEDKNDDHASEEDSEEENKITEEFRTHVKEFIRIDDLVREKQKEVRDLRNQKKPHEEYILNNLEQMHENIIEISDGKLIKNKSQTKAPLTSTIIREALSAKITDPQKINEIMEQMKELRPRTERKYLKRTQMRKIRKKIKTKIRKK